MDAGTRLLLKTLAKETDLSSLRTIADIGCGVGTIGLALKAHLPGARVILRDRDALAVDFTRWNGELNGIKPDLVEQELLLNGLEEGSLDLLVTNIPAKAGESVLEDFFLRSPNFLTDKGLVALVIVSPLREEAEALMERLGIEILYREHTKMHSVYHYRRKERRGEDQGLEPYIRHRSDYILEGRSYSLDTVYNIPDFDKIGWSHQLAAGLMKPHAKSGTWCFWNPGQGHIPVFFHKKCRPGADRIILTGRDLLQGRITAHNLLREGFEGECQVSNLSLFSLLPGITGEETLDLLVVDMNDPIPRTDWFTPLKDAARTVIKGGGLLVLYGKSSDVQQFTRGGNRGFTPCGDDRSRGNRCIILRRNPHPSV